MTAKILHLDKARDRKPQLSWTPEPTETLNSSLSKIRRLMSEMKEMLKEDKDLSSESLGKKTKP